MSEKDALNLVWNRIHSELHKGNQDDLKRNLFNELADMQEHGITVCSTGKFNRIIDTLNMADPVVSITHSKAIRPEMMTRSSKIREDALHVFETNHNKAERDLIEMGTAEESVQNTFDDNLKTTIKDTLKKEYVDSKIMSQSKFNKELEEWIDYI